MTKSILQHAVELKSLSETFRPQPVNASAILTDLFADIVKFNSQSPSKEGADDAKTA